MEPPRHEAPNNLHLLDAPSLPVLELLNYRTMNTNKDAMVDKRLGALKNTGNMCYLNALLHVLARVPGIQKWTQQHCRQHQCRSGNEDCALCNFGQDVYQLIAATNETHFEAKTVQRRGTWNVSFTSRQQQCAHEAFTTLLTACNEVDVSVLLAIEDVHIKQQLPPMCANFLATPAWQTFGGIDHVQVTCQECDSTSQLYETWNCLSLPLLPHSCTLRTLLQKYYSEEHVNDYDDRCQVCRVRQRRSKRPRPERWPTTLVLHLKRWKVVSFYPYHANKLSHKVEYGEHLEVDPQVRAYKLRGVVEHHGEANGGHYTSVVRCSDDRWYHCNDNSLPRFVSAEHAMTREAYMLVYEKTVP